MENNDVVIAENDIIPIDGAISSFKTHLQTHPRTILSAKFGDGKTFFLKEFTEKEEKEYLVLHLYPVNYQVCDNKDIFELVKYDILIQLLAKEVNLAIDEISDSVLWSYLIQSDGLDLLASILKKIGAISPNIESKILSTCVLGACSVKKFNKKFNEFKQKNTDDGLLQSFLSQKSVIYEYDVITSIIKETIKKYRSEENKKVVLVFDDMDRIDPAHLFRIMNVLSAHVDSYDNTTEGNKYGVDNIVLVMHYDNLKKIFHHFYGNDVDINGYVSKFMDKGYFEYSLNKQKNDYLYGMIQKATGMPLDLLKEFIPISNLQNKTVREIKSSIVDIDGQIQDDEKYKIQPNRAILRFFVVCRRLAINNTMNGVNSNLFKKIFEDNWKKMIELCVVYFAPKIDYNQPFEINIGNRMYRITIRQDFVDVNIVSSHSVTAYQLSKFYERLWEKIAF